MAIVNRDKDVSEQKEVISWAHNKGSSLGPINTGQTLALHVMAFPGVLQSMRGAFFGVSGAPLLSLGVQRHGGVGVGGTLVAASISGMVVKEWSSLGVQGYSGLAATGSTLLLLQAGDVLLGTLSGANTAVDSLALQIVVKKTQDVVSHNGVQT